ncbi:Protein GUCD1 [Hondaea fermentalgiana]|uniref:Protein GUCD1 n=1 Tax=Hondaea fermentalgiana TaxID=2315210 RepID=A0A2R5G7S6_9STRA|nr:Protein GUCD1 [Hondaea fermentalgiana]|eukprot:GBG27102.1 Protein GUCD1 [Hondaea fermentalgiana]
MGSGSDVAGSGADGAEDDACGPAPASQVPLVPFVQQEENWDCGLACVKMATGALRPEVEASKLTNAALEQLVQTRSVWTIDLAFAIRELGIPLVMYTTSTRVDTREYSGMDFYKEVESDQARVNARFERAAEAGIRVDERPLPRAELQSIVSANALQMAIVLVDVTVLRNAERSYGRKVLDFVVSAVAGHQFAGHYLLVIGYIAPFYEVRDPASSRPSTMVHEDVLERARSAPGTDDDILVLGEDLSHL